MMKKFFSGARDVDAGNERLTDLDSESEEDAQDEWAVESIEDRNEGEGGTLYLVRWAAPHDDEQTWESAEGAAGAAVKVQAFEHSRGQLDADAMANAGPGLGGAFVPFLQKPAGAAELVHELVRRPTVNLI